MRRLAEGRELENDPFARRVVGREAAADHVAMGIQGHVVEFDVSLRDGSLLVEQELAIQRAAILSIRILAHRVVAAVREGPVSGIAPRQAILLPDIRRESREHLMDIPGRPYAGEKAAEHRLEKVTLR